MQNMGDVFAAKAFDLISLTRAIMKAPFIPGRLGQMGLFATESIDTHTAVIEEEEGLIAILPTRTRGEAASVDRKPKRKIRTFDVPHIPHKGQIRAEDLVGKRLFGSPNELESIGVKVNKMLARMRQCHEVTHEYHRMGALQGSIKDADGSTELLNLFTAFDVSETTQDFDFDGSPTVKVDIITVKRVMEGVLGMGPNTLGRIHAFCGATFFDALTNVSEVKTAYERPGDGEYLRKDQRSGFDFCGCRFEEYVGTIDGVAFIPAAECRFFPVNVPGLFVQTFAPAAMIDTVNTQGQMLYAKNKILDYDMGVEIYTESNPLMLCTRPAVLVKGTVT